ncbi:hypothetical protein SDC9_144497 [bioreactor metagenome]|uniref:Uncharacterized protein n=1 Tax=bioreactor metagenome TaxID=1076179 RepID=A0A645E687_9ZZZZ
MGGNIILHPLHSQNLVRHLYHLLTASIIAEGVKGFSTFLAALRLSVCDSFDNPYFAVSAKDDPISMF